MKVWLIVITDTEWSNEPNYNVFTTKEKADEFVRKVIEDSIKDGYYESDCCGNADYIMEKDDTSDFISIYGYELIAE